MAIKSYMEYMEALEEQGYSYSQRYSCIHIFRDKDEKIVFFEKVGEKFKRWRRLDG